MMEHLDHSAYTPIAAIVVYQLNAGTSGIYNTNPYYIEHHHMAMRGKKAMLLQGQPLEKGHLAGIVAVLEENEQRTNTVGFLPNRLLSFSERGEGRALLWWCPPGRQTLLFDMKGFKASGQGNCPGLVFGVKDKSMAVFAVKGKRRPTPRSLLYESPFYNIYGDGKVCMGSATLPDGPFDTVSHEIAAYERCFFNSVFSGHLAGRKVLKRRGLAPVWRSQLKSSNPFPTDLLVPHHSIKNMTQLVNHMGI